MNLIIETLNHWGGRFLDFAWPMLWQSSLLILILFALDLAIRRRIRASIRYALWLALLVKLCLPPTLASPTSPAWWWPKEPATVVVQPNYTVTYGAAPLPDVSRNVPVYTPPKPAMTNAAWLLVASGGISVLLLVWLFLRWWWIARQVQRAAQSEELTAILNQTRMLAGLKSKVLLKVTDDSMSPAVCGLFRPVILIPKSLAEGLSGGRLRVVLLHELIHLRRRDVWLNFLQAFLQVVYWWHPLLWLANARIRRVREEAVDDAVMLALRDDAESYAPTLLAVAKLAFSRPMMSLGLVGIMESRSALRKRIERLVNFRAPRRAGLTFMSCCCILAFSAVAVPMGEAPAPAAKMNSADAAAVEQQSLTVNVDPDIFIRNVKAQAANSLLSPTNDYNAILLDLMDGEGLDCHPPNGIEFNTHTGEITTQNTPEKLEIFRRVIEQLNRADGHCELPLSNNPLRKNVTIEARIYEMSDTDFEKYTSDLTHYHNRQYGDDWWSASPEQYGQLVRKLEASGLPLIQRPRIQTASGITAEFFVGDETNAIQFDCKPYVASGFVDLALRGTVVSRSAGAALTNYFRTKASAEDRGGIVVRMKNYGGKAGNNVIEAIRVEISTNNVPLQERPQTANASQGPGAIQFQADRKRLLYLLDRTRLDHFGPYAQLPLSDVVQDLNQQTARLNSENGGVHFLTAENSDEHLPTIDPNTGAPVKGAASNGAEINSVLVTIDPPLTNVTLANVLDAIVMVANKPVEYSVLDKEIVFSPSSRAPRLFSRTFKVDDVFLANLEKESGSTTNFASVLTALKRVFSKAGMELSRPKSVFYNDRLGLLYVHATESDLDAIERIVARLGNPEPFIHIKAQFLEISRANPPSPGFDWYLGSISTTNATHLPGPAQKPAGDINGAAIPIGKLTGILTPENTDTVLRALRSRSGVEILSVPEATTLSGRQTEMRSTEIVTVITNFAFTEGSNSQSNSITPQIAKLETGPVLDTVATILPDGYMIDLKTTASVTGFLGYDQPTNTIVKYTAAGQKITLPTVLPRFDIQKNSAHVKLWDGQTVVLGGKIKTAIQNEKDKVPVLGDLPLIGRLFQSQTKTTIEKNLLVFITVTLVDPVGNRIHSDAEMAFAKNSFPPQDAP